MVTSRFLKFIKVESSVGILLLACALLAMIIDNSGWQHYYQAFLQIPFTVNFGKYGLSKPLLLWINEGLMAIFFMLVGLEIKREILIGELNTLRKLSLPGFAALGGIICPALIYALINWGDPQAIRGWAIPSATDIAFSLGVLALLGSRVSNSLRVFLTALAILDDLAAIVIITMFYMAKISPMFLVFASFCVLLLFLLNVYNVQKLFPYLIVGFLLWSFVLNSGVHSTLAGVILAFAIPLKDKNNPRYSMLRRLEGSLNPWVAYLILPLFAFANAGVSVTHLNMEGLLNPVTLGIILGLFVGKQVGVWGFSWVAVKLGLAKLPTTMNWLSLYGIAVLCGIGFTMSLFIGTLAFEGIELTYAASLRIGVLVGSVLSAIVGYAVLRLYCFKSNC